MKQPLGIVALLYGFGVLLGEFVQPPVAVLLSISLVTAAAALAHGRRRALWLGPLLALTGWTNLVLHTEVLSPLDLRNLLGDSASLVTVSGRLTDTPITRLPEETETGIQHAERTMAQLEVESLLRGERRQAAEGRIVVVTPGVLGREFCGGQSVRVTGVLAPPTSPVAEGLFDYRSFLRRQGIYYQLRSRSAADWQLRAPSIGRVPMKDRFLAWAGAALARGLPREDESLRLEWSLSLGDKTVLTPEVSEPFIRAATFHIFAVDGLRMAILFGIGFSIARMVRVPRAACGIVLVPVIWAYTGLTGWPASAIRASVMLTVLIGGWALRRPADLLNSLFGAALILLLWDPQQLFQAGFQLSFLVVLSMILILPALERCRHFLLDPDPLLADRSRPRWKKLLDSPARHVVGLLLTSMAAWIGSIPLVAYYFHIVTPVSAPANLVAVPLCMLVLASDFISLLLEAWLPAGAELFNHAGWFLMECIRRSSEWFAGWPDAYFYARAPTLFSIGLYYAALIAGFSGWLFRRPGRSWKWIGAAALAAIWVGRWEYTRSASRLTILPLNGGSAAFYEAARFGGKALVDCGNANAAESIVKPYLRGQGVNRLRHLILTHGEARQMAGADLILANSPVGDVVTGPLRFRSAAYRNFLGRLDGTRTGRRPVARGDWVERWKVLHPERGDNVERADDGALVLAADLEGTRVLLLSDLGRTGQELLLKRERELAADVVIAGLPQVSEPAGEALLDSMRPRILIIADSEDPPDRRAGAALRERLGRRGITVLYTSTAGAVSLSFRSGRWETETGGSRVRFW